jgi:hypothetical protein
LFSFIFVGEIVGEILSYVGNYYKISLYNFRLKKNGKYPVKIRVIWQGKFYFYLTGVDLSEEEFKEYHSRRDLKKQFDNIIYFSNKANKIIKDLGRNFS